MSKKKLPTPLPARKPRADAQRNRERILEVAKEVFTRDGAAASLDDSFAPEAAQIAWGRTLRFIDSHM